MFIRLYEEALRESVALHNQLGRAAMPGAAPLLALCLRLRASGEQAEAAGRELSQSIWEMARRLAATLAGDDAGVGA